MFGAAGCVQRIERNEGSAMLPLLGEGDLVAAGGRGYALFEGSDLIRLQVIKMLRKQKAFERM